VKAAVETLLATSPCSRSILPDQGPNGLLGALRAVLQSDNPQTDRISERVLVDRVVLIETCHPERSEGPVYSRASCTGPSLRPGWQATWM